MQRELAKKPDRRHSALLFSRLRGAIPFRLQHVFPHGINRIFFLIFRTSRGFAALTPHLSRNSHPAATRLITFGAICLSGIWFSARAQSFSSAASQSNDSPGIAFASTKDGNWEIYMTDVAGRSQTRLTRRDAQDRFPLWSPEGTDRLRFASRQLLGTLGYGCRRGSPKNCGSPRPRRRRVALKRRGRGETETAGGNLLLGRLSQDAQPH